VTQANWLSTHALKLPEPKRATHCFVLIPWGGVRLGALGAPATSGPTVLAPDDRNMEQTAEWKFIGYTNVSRENLPQIPHYLTGGIIPGCCGGNY
jgi:hypothetical protein